MNNNAITITYFDTMRFRIAAVAIDCGGHDVLVFLIFFASFTNLNSVSRRFKNAKWFLNFYRKYFFILDTNINAIRKTYFELMRFRVSISDDVVFVQDKI